jgi:hypothetical protein
MEGVVEAAIHAGLPEDYIRSLALWLPNSQAPAAQAPEVRPRWSAPSSTLRKPR